MPLRAAQNLGQAGGRYLGRANDAAQVKMAKDKDGS
jgi:hypothetical protein